MDGPAGRNYRLLIAHDDMACLLRLSHVVHDEGVFRHLKIQIHLHTPVMCMAGHGIPHASGFQPGHAHLQLAALHLAGKDVFADHTVVCVFQAAKLHFVLVLYDNDTLLRYSLRLNQHGRAGSVGRCGIQIKFCRRGGIVAGKDNLLCAHADVHGLLEAYPVHPAVHGHGTRASDIDGAQFPSLAEVRRPQFLARRQGNGFHRHCRTRNDSVNVAVYQLNLTRYEEILNQKLLSQALRGIMLHIPGGYCCSKFHADTSLSVRIFSLKLPVITVYKKKISKSIQIFLKNLQILNISYMMENTGHLYAACVKGASKHGRGQFLQNRNRKL